MLAVEYDGPQHYECTRTGCIGARRSTKRDRYKDARCAEMGVASSVEEVAGVLREMTERGIRVEPVGSLGASGMRESEV
jgi:hypothetical protein